jgi:hypothetical protein
MVIQASSIANWIDEWRLERRTDHTRMEARDRFRMKHVIRCILLGLLMVSVGSARHKKGPQTPRLLRSLTTNLEQQSCIFRLRKTRFTPRAPGRMGSTHISRKKDDGSVHFSVRVKYLDFLALVDSTWNCQSATFTIDAGDEVHLDLNQVNVNTNSDGRITGFDFHGLEIEPLVRRLASTTEAWLVLGYNGGPRKDIHFNQENLGIFRVVVSVADSL